MRELIAYLTAEQPRINATLEQETSRLNGLVQPVAAHVLKAGGKRLRPLLTLLFGRMLGYGADDIYPLACSVELLHSATLLHDDIIDDADLRRGNPAAHTLFGNTKTVLAGDVLLAQANTIVARYGDARLTTCIAEAIMATATGEIEEIEYLRSTEHPQETYIDIIKGKTAFLLQASCQLGAMVAKATPAQIQAATDFGMNLGIAFQIVDDALDFAPSAKDIGKPVAGDLREGKLTPPLLMYRDSLQADARKSFVRNFEEGTFTEDEILGIAASIRETGLDVRTRELADSYLAMAQAALDTLPECPERLMLGQTIEYVRDRKH
ncbi:polyprenyl synthetase family protein [Desulfovibrio subterraneus]|jgi:octaprenyl-diphosphate synthase|uniref:Octaprenyl-diphosphate synthase n=1 Tax=Desulfovibrio subterraneus TaxID=2718620 RepID=A0A7J0BLK6_9BACT|nr:polyprenyl synthetase family protein [Desulfovibrio subterraneus]WBF66432.1 polyprenyl synthetase family protein [Desulfovibrio subterraneus]GFM34550.1 octaprenyl-diphosphate synthase [Desulfovibrio subterraneus]